MSDDNDQGRWIDGKDAGGADIAGNGGDVNKSNATHGLGVPACSLNEVVGNPDQLVIGLGGPVDGPGGTAGEMGGLIGPSVWHRSIDGTEMATIRQGLGVTQAVFAAQCGHSQQFQVQIEQPGPHEISIDKARDIVTAISFYK